MTAYSIAALLSMLAVKYAAQRLALPEVQPWKAPDGGAAEKGHAGAIHA